MGDSSFQLWDENWDRQIVTATDEQYRRQFIDSVHESVFLCIGKLIRRCRERGIPIQNAAYADAVSSITGEFLEKTVRGQRLTEDLARQILELWNNEEAIQIVWRERCSFQCHPSTNYFLQRAKLDEILREDYIPSNSDIVRVRDATMKQANYNFLLYGVRFSITDDKAYDSLDEHNLPGTIRTWLNMRDELVTERVQVHDFILFVCAASDYNQIDTDAGDAVEPHTYLDTAVNDLRLLMNNQTLRQKRVRFLIFLNKKDLLEQKLAEYGDVPEEARNLQHTGSLLEQTTNWIHHRLTVMERSTQCGRAQPLVPKPWLSATEAKTASDAFESVSNVITLHLLRNHNII